MFMFWDALPPCGIGGAETSGGPCTGSYMPSDAGKDVFSAVSSLPVVRALLAAAALVAAVIFAVWIVRTVARLFTGAPSAAASRPVVTGGDEAFWAARGREANASQPDADFSADARGDSDDQDDTEDDVEAEDDADSMTHRLGYGR